MRYIEPYVRDDLQKKMVFVGGPRQVGKTTMAKSILVQEDKGGRYLNWDYDEDRQDILAKKWTSEDRLLVLDELHKFPRWKNWLKGLYDVTGEEHSFLVTGSARLDVYRRGGDSLLGRYHYWRLHPFTLDEIPADISPQDAFTRLMT
ncbi:MAG: AAA family ATPase, partial [Desulfobulbaceae bacterium]|nr:AAA family ATPase [Desulfobulbaceae bacterium]